MNVTTKIEPRELSIEILEALEQTGYVLIKNFILPDCDDEEARSKFEILAPKIGIPVSHDVHDSIVWDIKAAKTSASEVITYSQHQHKADLHTDSQYSFYPEDYFGLLTLKKASCGGGESLLLSLKDILHELRSTELGQEVERILRENDYPFMVPTVFKREEEDQILEMNWGPILRENEIRFRVDTLEKAVTASGDRCTKEQIDAYYYLKNLICNSPSLKRFFLERGDLLFVNNKTMLHGREAFQDPERHLLRVRMNKNING